MPYRDYLRTPEWRKPKAAARHRANDTCAMDPSHTGPLEVHHRTYDNLGAELPEDLLVLCKECHRLHHSHHGRPSANARRAARRKAKLEAEFKGLVLRLCIAAGLVIGLLRVLES